jgi:hypothetical protein
MIWFALTLPTTLRRATEIDGKFSVMALEDPDLEPLWNLLPLTDMPGGCDM